MKDEFARLLIWVGGLGIAATIIVCLIWPDSGWCLGNGCTSLFMLHPPATVQPAPPPDNQYQYCVDDTRWGRSCIWITPTR